MAALSLDGLAEICFTGLAVILATAVCLELYVVGSFWRERRASKFGPTELPHFPTRVMREKGFVENGTWEFSTKTHLNLPAGQGLVAALGSTR